MTRLRTVVLSLISFLLFASIALFFLLGKSKKYSDLLDEREKNVYFDTRCVSACKDIASKDANCVQGCVLNMQKQWQGYKTCREQSEGLSHEQASYHSCFYDGPITPLPPDGIPSMFYKASLTLLLPLADLGSAEAQAELGQIYESGLGIARDYAKAVEWYRMAADQGSEEAQYALGDMYYHGRGVKEDYIEAMKWFRLAAAQGAKGAQRFIGVMYRSGLGVKQDDAEACFWYELAGLTHREALLERKSCDARLTPEQKTDIKKRIKEWHAAHVP